MPFRWLWIPVLCLALAGCGGAGGGSGGYSANLVVTTLGDAGAGSLRQVVDDAPSGALITFDPAIQGGLINLSERIRFEGKRLTVDGGPSGMELVLAPGSGDPIFHVHDGGLLDMRSLTLSGGEGHFGGALQVVLASAALQDVRVTNCAGVNGGGLYFSFPDRPVVLRDVHIVACSGEEGGAVYIESGESLIERCSFVFNSAVAGGGGAVYLRGGTHTVRNTTMHGNSTSWAGGGVYAVDSAFFGNIHLSVVGCTITGGSADIGGGIYLDCDEVSDALVRQSVVAENLAPASADIHAGGVGLDFSGAYNLVGDGAGSTLWHGLDHNMVGDAFSPLDPMLAAPVVGPTQTMYRPSEPLSPVRHAVPLSESVTESGAALAEDQLGVDRALGGMADIGAVDS